MTEAEERESILVVEDDVYISRLLEMELSASGYEVRLAGEGKTALELAFERCPDLVLADVMMPEMDGFELTRRLREDPRTEAVSVIILTARGLKADKLEGLTSGADDYMVKPFDNDEMLARVRGALRRAKYMRAQSPLTGLPGNVRIEDEIQTRIDLGEDFALMYLDLDHFKAYSDKYGFARGDEALRRTGWLIRDTARRVAGAGTFIGHIGGDDFVVVTKPDQATAVARAVVSGFDDMVPSLYDADDVALGYIEAENRRGKRERFPLLAISIGIASTACRPFGHRVEAVGVATEMKNYAKRAAGSSFEHDRRGPD